MALDKTWAQRCAESTRPPQPMRMQSANAPIGGNSPTEVIGIIEDTPGNTWMNRALGPTRKLPGRYSKTGQLENPYDWLQASSLYPTGAGFPYTPTGGDR